MTMMEKKKRRRRRGKRGRRKTGAWKKRSIKKQAGEGGEGG